MDEQQFRDRAEAAIRSLKDALIRAEDSVEMEVEEQGGVLTIAFDDPPTKFVITPNSAARQIWISALVSSFKLDLNGDEFVWPKSGESLKDLVARLIGEQTGEPVNL